MKKINKTLNAAKVTRRSVLKGAAATGAAAAIGPWYIPNAFAAPLQDILRHYHGGGVRPSAGLGKARVDRDRSCR